MRGIFITFTLAMVLMLVASIHGESTCRVAVNRVIGNNNLYVVACLCDDNPEFVGRAVRFLDPDTPDTIAQGRVTLRCIERRTPGMIRACEQSPTDFERRGAKVLEICMGKRPTNPTKEGLKRFRFIRKDCATEFRELDAARKEVLLVCACPQKPGFSVNPGVIQFITEGSPSGASEEQKFIQRCTENTVKRLDRVCRRLPRRFDLRGAQTFNVCCKRVRVKFPLAKLKCQATVPDNISELGLTFA